MLRVAVRIFVAAVWIYLLALPWILPDFIDDRHVHNKLALLYAVSLAFVAGLEVQKMAFRLDSKKAAPKADSS